MALLLRPTDVDKGDQLGVAIGSRSQMRRKGENGRRAPASSYSRVPKAGDIARPKPDLVLVTVNDYETQAVHDAFLAATGTEAVPVPIGDRLYHDLGTINGTKVYHVVSEMGSGGPGSMQQSVDKAIRALSPGAVIAIGIAFGVSESDQRIGEILISRQLLLYELQRAGNDIVLRGDKPHAATRLINHFDTFKQVKWKGAKVRMGLILTGEKLIDSKDYRDQLLKLQAEAVGGEMEGAGLYVASAEHKVDWIVIKAICDWADGKKGVNKKQRQQKAANNAADFLVKSLEYATLRKSNSEGLITPDNGRKRVVISPKAGRDSWVIPDSSSSGKVIYSDRQEWLYSNLLKAEFPDRIYVANTPHRFAATVISALKEEGNAVGPEWLLTSKQIISFHDLRKPPWDVLCDGVRAYNTRGWSETEDPDRRRDFVRLLNHCLRGLTWKIGLGFTRSLGCYYFLPTPDLQPKSVPYRSLRKNTSRDVFAVYYRKDDPGRVAHYRHAGFYGSFQRFGHEWFLQINPTYVYTVDGHRISKFHSQLLAGIKRFDRNAAVIGQVVMWGEFLNPDSPLFPDDYPYLRLGRPECIQVNREIDDAAWKTQDGTVPKTKGRRGRS